MQKHQGQSDAGMTDKYGMSNSGATKFQQSTRAGKNPQSSAMTAHQGQMGSRSGTMGFQNLSGDKGASLAMAKGKGSISGTSGKKIKSNSGGMSY